MLIILYIKSYIKSLYNIMSILYKTLLARKLSEPEDGRCRPKHIVLSC